MHINCVDKKYVVNVNCTVYGNSKNAYVIVNIMIY